MLRIEGTSIEQDCQRALKTIDLLLSECSKKLTQIYGRELIAEISCRMKTSESIVKKLKKKGYPITLDTAAKSLSDIAGVRIICCYQDDVYRIQKALYHVPELTILKEKDFIKRPKKSGYRSLHMITSVPIACASGIKNVRVEIQIRTVVMHLWAELEHEKCYKKQERKGDPIYRTLKLCAKLGCQLDTEMQNIRNTSSTAFNK